MFLLGSFEQEVDAIFAEPPPNPLADTETTSLTLPGKLEHSFFHCFNFFLFLHRGFEF